MPANDALSEENVNDALFYMETRIRALDEQSRSAPPVEPLSPTPRSPG